MKNYKSIICVVAAVCLLGTAAFCGFRTLQAILLQIQGYSIAEIAAALGMKEDTVYKRLGRLKQKIKKLLG